MARGRSSRSGERDTSDIAISADPLSGLMLRPTLSPLTTDLPSTLLEVEDRRTFHPERDYRPAISFSGPSEQAIGVKRHERFAGQTIPHAIGFSDPSRVVVCVRRKQRREVLFAKRRTRKGAGARHHRRNWWSHVHCK